MRLNYLIKKRNGKFNAAPSWDATGNHVTNLLLNVTVIYSQRLVAVFFQHTRQHSGKW